VIFGIGFLAVIGVSAFLIIRAVSGHSSAPSGSSHVVRRFFQYSLLFGLVSIVASGTVGLLNRIISPTSLVEANDVVLARDISFVLVGAPVLIGVSLWTKRTVKTDSMEVHSFGWAAYLFAITMTSLLITLTGVATVLAWAVGLEKFDSYALTQAIIWSAVWGVHFELNRRVTPLNRSKFLYLNGSLSGLIPSLVGIAMIVAGIARELIGYSEKDLLAGVNDPLRMGLVLLMIGAPIWFLYWIKLTMKSTREVLWLGYVLIIGVAGGLITAIVSGSTLLYRILVWFIGDPSSTDFYTHFRSMPTLIGSAVAGLLLLWYHNHFASDSRTSVRNEVQRIYEYLISGIALIAATVGFVLVLVSVFDVFVRNTLVDTSSAINTLLAAITLLVVGTPIWYLYWHRIQIHVKRQPLIEATAGTRRVYLFVLFGAGAALAVVTLISAVNLLLQAIFANDSLSDALRDLRYPVSILLGTIAITAYHWNVFSAERSFSSTQRIGPKRITLIGPLDENLRKQLRDLTGGSVQAWESMSSAADSWPIDETLNLVKASSADRLVLTLVSGKVTAIEVKA
jgi:hypothetical protein